MSTFRNRSVNVHAFAMVPRAEIPRSSFRMQKGLKTTFDAGWLVPCLVEEVLPGDTFTLKMTAFARMATPLYPFMDNLHFETFFFFVPNRLVWDNWQRFMGERPEPDSSTDFLVPQITGPAGGYVIGTLGDYMGLPTQGQVDPVGAVNHSALPARGYALIWNEWFRDQNLQDPIVISKGDGPDAHVDYPIKRRGKRHDYFTACLPWPQKEDPVSLSFGGNAPVIPDPAGGTPTFASPGFVNEGSMMLSADNPAGPQVMQFTQVPSGNNRILEWSDPSLVADLSTVAAATINQIRQAFQIQRLLERDARGGTRYTEIVRAHFGVISPDARLQRPEYLGGGYSPISVNPVASTNDGGVPLGELGAFSTMLAREHGFTGSFTEHGYIIGMMSVRADLTYQQGLRRHWSRRTRYDYYFPVFAMLGEQAVLNKEIYAQGTAADDDVFGYQERWAEYRYNPSEITGLFRSTAEGTLDVWHLAQRFDTVPVLNESFIQETPPIDRILAVDSAEVFGEQFLLDAFFDIHAARPLPMYSVPGLIDHF